MIRLLLQSLVIVAVTQATSMPREKSHVAPHLEDGRIVGGYPVSITKHPHQVSMQFREWYSLSYRHICGGSIYSARIIITAAHCVRFSPANQLRIVAGTDLRSGIGGVRVFIEKIITHDKYEAWSYHNDVALLILSTELPINNVSIKPIALTSQKPKEGAISQVTGWGNTEEGGDSSDVLLEVEVPIISNEKCSEFYINGYYHVYDSMLCAGYLDGGKDACQGDSGGPLVVNGKLAGIVSWGYGCARPGYPGVYSDVAYLKEWIESTVNSYFPPIVDPYIDFY